MNTLNLKNKTIEELTEFLKIQTETPAQQYIAAVLGLKKFLKSINHSQVVLGVSGGLDSAIVATIASDAIGGKNVFGVSMPTEFSSECSFIDALELMENISTEENFSCVPLHNIFDSYKKSLDNVSGIALENLQARIRGTLLMTLSNQFGYIVLSPGNKSEFLMGYSTIYGDSVGGYAPIIDAYKTEVYEMAKWRNNFDDSPIPKNSITKLPSAELAPNQFDSDSLPDYEILDSFLKDYEGIYRGFDEGLIFKYSNLDGPALIKKIRRANWKREQSAPGTRLRGKNMGKQFYYER